MPCEATTFPSTPPVERCGVSSRKASGSRSLSRFNNYGNTKAGGNTMSARDELEPKWPPSLLHNRPGEHQVCNYDAVRTHDDSGLFCNRCGFMWSATAARLRLAIARIDVLEAALHGLVDHEDQPCRFDHHGYCQDHTGGFGEHGCTTAIGRKALGLTHSPIAPPKD